ncbi:MAG: NUDIX hydrolase [Bryobacteraceae bacterium]|nr:NUDIX hydrolase [Bryobacteraceae bacterium]
MQNPIRRVSSREAYRGRLVTVRVDDVVLPQGSPAEFEFIQIKPGACVLAMEDNGDVYLVREWKYAVDRPSVECVIGGIEPGEEPLEAARRELREEAGLAAAEYIAMGVVDPFTSMLLSPTSLFLARGLTKVPHEREEAEIIELLRVPLDEAVQMVMSGVITHGASCTLILKSRFMKNYANFPLPDSV